MTVRDDLIEEMVQAAITDAFQQKGMSRDKQLEFDAAGQSYSFMGVNLRQCMEAAVTALEKSGWTITRAPVISADTPRAIGQDRGLSPDQLNAESDG